MATRAQRNRLAVQPLPELPKRRDAKRDARINYVLAGLGVAFGLAYYFFF